MAPQERIRSHEESNNDSGGWRSEVGGIKSPGSQEGLQQESHENETSMSKVQSHQTVLEV